jgi:hypothetical protein
MLVRCGTWKVKGTATCVYCCALSASSTPSPRAVATAGVLQRASG